MRSPRGMKALMMAVVAILAAAVTAAGQQTLSARLADERPLGTTEIDALLRASRQAMAGKAFRTYGGMGGAEFLADDRGIAIVNYGGERLTHYTRMPAAICPGTPETARFSPPPQGELVIEYSQQDGQWAAHPRGSRDEEQLSAMFPPERTDSADMEDAGVADLRGRVVRGIRYPYEPREEARFEADDQTLWFDVETLLPVRWVLSIMAPQQIEYAYWIDYDPDLRIDLPDVRYVPDCIGGAGMRYLPSWAAALTYLHNSGWAVRTNNYVLVFDYVPDNPEAIEALELAVDPTAVQDRQVAFFVTHGHTDHFSEDVWRWDGVFDDVTYVLGFDPGRELPAVRQRIQLEPRADAEVAGLRVRTVASTDEGVGFLVEADGLRFFHAGDHALWSEQYREPYEAEIRWLAGRAAPVDVGFFPVATGNCEERDSLFEGAFWAIEQLDVQMPLPMHVRCAEQVDLYRKFAVRLAAVSDKRSRVIEGPGRIIGYRKRGYPVRRTRSNQPR